MILRSLLVRFSVPALPARIAPISPISPTAPTALLLCVVLLTACAPPLKDPWGLAVLRGEAAAADPADPTDVPHTLQADLTLIAHNLEGRAEGRAESRASRAPTFPLPSRLYAEPGRRYRLDIFGLFTPVAASWAWEADAWRLVRHDTREVVTGRGTSFIPLAASDRPLVIPDVHAVLGFLWGQPLPGFDPSAAGSSPGRGAGEALGERIPGEGEKGIVTWTQGGKPWRARFDPATGLCLEASSPDMTLRYGRYERQGARVLPREIEVWIDGMQVLTLSVRARSENPVWKRDPFELTIPAGYDATILGR